MWERFNHSLDSSRQSNAVRLAYSDGFRFPLMGLFLLALFACARPAPVPVETLNTGSSALVVPFGSISKNETVYTVQRGDTLSNIAWQYGTDVEQIASRNGLNSAHTIYPGQKLIIKVSNKKKQTTAKRVIKTPFQRHLDGSGYKLNKNNNKRIQSGGSISSTNGVIIRFEWPARGEVVRNFQEGVPPSEGIEIAARHGDPVYAAADGVVVYVGEGLRGLGKTVILLHDNQFLTAYSNNRKTRVSYDQAVKKGQVIAEVGGRASETSRLYFQVRSSGRPVDPLRYLTPKD